MNVDFQNVCSVNNRSWTKCRGQKRNSSCVRSVLDCTIGIGNRRRSVTCLNCDTRDETTSRVAKTFFHPAVVQLLCSQAQWRKSACCVLFGKASALVTSLCNDEMGFAVALLDR